MNPVIFSIIHIVLGLAVLAMLLTAFFFLKRDNVSPFISDIDGKEYVVRNNKSPENMKTAANYLANLNARINKLVDHMYQNNIPDSEVASRLKKRWTKCKLKETGENDKDAALTVDKSIEIRICIRDADGNFEDMNTAMFVILHELAHVMSISYDHKQEFYDNFDVIAKTAAKVGVYIPEDFTKSPKKYCGVNITKTPCSNGACPIN